MVRDTRVAVMVMGLLPLGTAVAEEQLPLTMTVSLEESYDDAYSTEVFKIHVRLSNRHTRSISVRNDHLPWLGVNDELLAPRIVRLDNPQAPLERGGPTATWWT
jgi:hypothetical protein